MDEALPANRRIWSTGEWIRARRTYLLMTQDHLAERVGQVLEQLNAGKVRGENCSSRTIRSAEATKPISLRIATGLVHALEIPQADHAAFVHWFRQHASSAGWQPPNPDRELVHIPNAAVPLMPLSDKANQHHSAAAIPFWLQPLSLPQLSSHDCFSGRTAELATLNQILDTQHCAIISGVAGIGKSELAKILAYQRYDKRHIFWHTFHQNDDIIVLLWQLAVFLARQGQSHPLELLQASLFSGGQLPPINILWSYLIQVLQSHEYLICFDDLPYPEKDLELDTHDKTLYSYLAQLWRAAQHGGLEIIATARELTNGLLDSPSVVLGGLQPDDIGRLLELRKEPQSADVVTTLAQVTEGNPAMIEIAIDLLKQRRIGDDLAEQVRSAPTIQQFLLQHFDAALGHDERDVMSALAVLLGYGGSREAIEATLGDQPVQRQLLSLVRRQLVRCYHSEQGPVYQIHTILQTFYYDALAHEQRQGMHRAAAQYYEMTEHEPLLAARHYVQSGDYSKAAALTWLIVSRGQVRLLRALLHDFGSRMAGPLPPEITLARCEIDILLGETQQTEQAYQSALVRLDLQPDTLATRELKARAYRGLGDLLEFEAPRQALEWLQRGVAEIAGTGILEEAILSIRIGSVQLATGQPAEALATLALGLRLLPNEAGHWRARAFVKDGVARCMLGDLSAGLKSYTQALIIYAALKDDWGAIGVQHNLGIVKQLTGSWPGAEQDYLTALQRAKALGSVVREVDIELCLGVLRTAQGDFAAARATLSHALELARRHRMHEQIIHIQSNLADLAIRAADLATAANALHEAEQLAVEIGSDYQLPEIYRAQAALACGQRHFTRAHERASRAIQLAQAEGAERDEALGRCVYGQILAEMGATAEALASFEQAHALLADQDPYEIARIEHAWGQALLATDQPRGQALLRKALTAFQALGATYDERLAERLVQGQ